MGYQKKFVFVKNLDALSYVKFTNGPGTLPDICIDLWQKIWQMAPEELGGDRAYRADFEMYDERARDKLKAEIDLYIGVI